MNGAQQAFRLCWEDQVVGNVTSIGPGDFDWWSAKLEIETDDADLLAVLNWISEGVNSEDGPGDPPFRDELVDNWFLMWPDGSKHEINIPCVDLTDSSIEIPVFAVPRRARR